jgi:ferredoxin
MASHIRFDPPNVAGLVAAETTVAAAAERLGVGIELACGGRGECTSCAVEVLENPFSLSQMTEAEHAMLTDEQILASLRLGCQAKLGEGECAVKVVGPLGEPSGEAAGEQKEETAEPSERERARASVVDAFSALPASEQLSTALELQLKVAGDLIGAIVETPLRVGEQILDSIFGSSEQAKPKAGEREIEAHPAPAPDANETEEKEGAGASGDASAGTESHG